MNKGISNIGTAEWTINQYRFLCSSEKKAWKNWGLKGIEHRPVRYWSSASTLTNWASKPTGSWSLDWFVIYPGTMKMKWWIKIGYCNRLWCHFQLINRWHYTRTNTSEAKQVQLSGLRIRWCFAPLKGIEWSWILDSTPGIPDSTYK